MRMLRIGVGALAVVLLTVGCAGGGVPEATGPTGETSTTEVLPTATTATPLARTELGDAPSQSAAPSSSPSASPSVRPASKPTATTSSPAAAKPAQETQAPPPPPPPEPTGCPPRHEGSPASRAQMKSALADAAAKTYWPTSAPDIRIPSTLVKATAWQESGWQSTIIACDGGIGLMQVMPATADWMNQRFGQSYDVWDYRDNAYLGANYLAWLTKYIGDLYFDGDYRLDAALCSAELNSCLLNAVIASYNYGHAAVASGEGPITIPNPRYVGNVRALMTECVCLAY
nr:lytic transglycosylase domain-containing protein [Salinispora cortesiana]